jgi:hypothetical protein
LIRSWSSRVANLSPSEANDDASLMIAEHIDPIAEHIDPIADHLTSEG